jgi:uncharacterized protein (TIGR03086 family)
MSDPLALLEMSTSWARTKIAGTDPAQYGDRTPCVEWTVRDLLNHMIGGAHMYAMIVRGEYSAAAFEDGRDFIGDDPAASYDAAIAELFAAAAKDGAVERVVSGTVGEAPVALHAGLLTVDHAMHGWDLAKATGQDATIPPEVADAGWAIYGGNIPAEFRGGWFGTEIEMGTETSTQDKLLAYTGRDPSWT